MTWSVTTSWDDAHPADLRLAEELASRGLQGTFYFSRECEGLPRLSPASMKQLANVPGMEVGAHTLTHPDLRHLSDRDMQAEIAGSKAWLEDLLGREVPAFCYPRGLHNRRAVEQVRAAGFRSARTTKGGTTRPPASPFAYATTLQLYPHPRHIQLRHALKERHWSGLAQQSRLRSWSKEPATLMHAFHTQGGDNGVLHLWGHSWEIERHDMWAQLGRALDCLASIGTPMTNTAVLEAVSPAGPGPTGPRT